MITLTPITDCLKLQEYYRFRYHIYNESRLKRFVANADGIDKDAYDDHAHHYGWYVDGKLVGCVRFVEPDNSVKPLPMFNYLTDEAALDAVCMYIAMRRAHGQRMIYASRFCLAPEHRGLRTAREFVLAMVMTMQPLGFEHGLFDCNESQSAFYRLIGFEIVGAPSYAVPSLQQRWTIFECSFQRLVQHNAELMGRMGFKQGLGMKKAA